MNIIKKTIYSLFLKISIFFLFFNSVKADELDIFLAAVSKNYCTCMFVSELNPVHCGEMLNNLVMATIENDELLIGVSNEMDINIDAELNEVSISVYDRGVKSVFNGQKGCFLDNIK